MKTGLETDINRRSGETAQPGLCKEKRLLLALAESGKAGGRKQSTIKGQLVTFVAVSAPSWPPAFDAAMPRPAECRSSAPTGRPPAGASPPAPARRRTRTEARSLSLVGLWLVASAFWLFRAGDILLRLKHQGSRIPIILSYQVQGHTPLLCDWEVIVDG
jgi:hypothetical protein